MKPLSFYCDCEQTQTLMGMYGDRLEKLSKSDLCDLISIFSAAINSDYTDPHRAGDLLSLASVMSIETTDDLETALDVMDYFDRSDELDLLYGLAAMLGARSEGQ